MQRMNKNDYIESLNKLQYIFKEYNPLVILRFMLNYGLTAGFGKEKKKDHIL